MGFFNWVGSILGACGGYVVSVAPALSNLLFIIQSLIPNPWQVTQLRNLTFCINDVKVKFVDEVKLTDPLF
jgi:hypothetical protein